MKVKGGGGCEVWDVYSLRAPAVLNIVHRTFKPTMKVWSNYWMLNHFSQPKRHHRTLSSVPACNSYPFSTKARPCSIRLAHVHFLFRVMVTILVYTFAHEYGESPSEIYSPKKKLSTWHLMVTISDPAYLKPQHICSHIFMQTCIAHQNKHIFNKAFSTTSYLWPHDSHIDVYKVKRNPQTSQRITCATQRHYTNWIRFSVPKTTSSHTGR